MRKKDETLYKQLESILKELEEGKEESAASATMERIGTRPKPFRTLFKLMFKFWGVKIFLFIILLAGVILGSVWLFSGSSLKQETSTFVEQVQELATLATAEAHIKVILEQEDNKLFGKDIQIDLPGTKREILLVVPATVIAGVNLKEITPNHIKVNDKEKEIEMVLPRATLIQDPVILMDEVETFSDKGLFRGEIKWTEGFDLAAVAQDQVKQEAVEIGLLQTAEQNAEKVLKEFFSSLGYTAKISFE